MLTELPVNQLASNTNKEGEPFWMSSPIKLSDGCSPANTWQRTQGEIMSQNGSAERSQLSEPGEIAHIIILSRYILGW
jgi:hypothetical protein